LLFHDPVWIAGVQVLKPEEERGELVHQEATTAHHVGQDARGVLPLQQGAATGLLIKDPEGDKVFGVDSWV